MGRHTLHKMAQAAATMALTAVLVALTPSVSAQTLEKKAAAQHTYRYGDQSLEATIRTDERYGHDGLFQGPRGWHYWKYLEHPSRYRTQTSGQTPSPLTSSAAWRYRLAAR